MKLADAIRKYSDDMYKRTELVKGRVVVRRIPYMFSKQGFIETDLTSAITNYAGKRGLGQQWGKVGYLIDQEVGAETMRCGAITFIKAGRDHKPDPQFSFITIPADLVVEFINQPYVKKFDYPLPPDLDNEDNDSYWPEKLADYQRFGMKLVWIIDLTKEVVHVYSQPEWKSVTLQGDDILDAGDALPGFKLKVRHLFKPDKLREKFVWGKTRAEMKSTVWNKNQK